MSTEKNKTYFIWTTYYKGEKRPSQKTEYKLDGNTLYIYKNAKERNAEGKMEKPILVYFRVKE